jgi:hypothetical protein
VVIDPRRASDKLDDHSHALTGMGVNSQGAGLLQGRIAHKTASAACDPETMILWLSTAWRLGGVIGLERTSRPARMANADTMN